MLERITPLFDAYESLLAISDQAFEKVQQAYPEKVTCKKGCSDCCSAIFDLALIEALYLNYSFNKRFDLQQQAPIIERANKADRTVYKLKKKSYKAIQEGCSEEDVLRKIAEERVRCPLLNDENQCDMYDNRPLTCRVYGIPTAIGEEAHICGLSGFQEGESYPTFKLDRIRGEIQRLSLEAAILLQSKYPKLAEMLVPLSMALLTTYDEEYLGVVKQPEKKNEPAT